MGLTKIVKIIYIFILVIVGGFASEVKAYYASTAEETTTITTSAYEDLTFEFDQEVYGSNMPINITVNNPNPYAVSYTFAFDNDATYQVDGASVASYIVEANSTKTNVIVVSGISGSSLEININVTSPYTESYTETIALDVEAPVGSITSTNNQASSQTVTLNMTDNIGVSAYYFGTNSNPGISDYTEIETTSLAVINETVSNNGTYYLFVKDISGNIYNTSVDFYKVILESTGGSVSPTSIVAMSGNEISLPTPSSSSKEFIEWNTTSNGSGTEYTTSYTGTGNGSTTLYAIWQEKSTLYSVLENEATSGSGYAQKYTGAHQDSYAGTGTENIYYYNATSDANATTILDKNNVIFAGFCWQMLRTTDTGGVKIIYNGESVDGQCLNTTPSIGNVEFNADSTSSAHVGYMYNSTYLYKALYTLREEIVIYEPVFPIDDLEYYYFSDEYIIDVDSGSFELVEPYQLSSINNYEDLIGKYMAASYYEVEEGKYFMVFPIYGIDEYYFYTSFLDDSPYEIDAVFGDDYVDNGNGTYTLTNPVTTNKSEWFEVYESLDGNYMCLGTSATCNDIYIIASTSGVGVVYSSILLANSNKYASSFTYNENEGKYYLSGDQQTIPDLLSDYSNLSNMHYTCWNSTGSCERISYIYNTSYGEFLYYIELSDGIGIEDALEEMLSSNTTDSTIKQAIDDWYQSNLLSYTNYLEDTVFCNDRSIRALGGWDPNGGDIESYLQFNEYIVTSDLSCSNETDRFSVSNPNAQLTYPVGLASSPEIKLLGNDTLRASVENYWLASPYSFEPFVAKGRVVYTRGFLSNYDVEGIDFGVRPSVSLAPGTEYSSGDGSMANPYVVNMNIGGGTEEDEKISATIISTNNQTSSQTVTLNMTDNIGISAYYFGTKEAPSTSDYTEIESTTLAVVNEIVDNNGTYYLFVKNVSGNIFNISADFYKVVLAPTGGSVNPTSIVAKSGSAIKLPIPISSGSRFQSWNTASDGSGNTYTTNYTGTGNGSIDLYAIWETLSTIYSVLENEATSGSGLAQTYTGEHQDSYAGTGTENIYYYNATSDTNATTILDKNNVIFAGFCWQMLRTTDTGGVKIIYNGEAVDGQCLNTRVTHAGYGNRTVTSLSSTYYYGTSYTLDGGIFSLAGETKSAQWSDGTYQDLIGWYTCKSSNETGVCNTLYYVDSYYTSSEANVWPLGSEYHYSTIGSVNFNEKYTSPAYVGYMYNKVYLYNSKKPGTTSYLYANSFTYSNGKYYLSGEQQIISDWESNYNKLSNTHYTCWNTSGECDEISYIYYTGSNNADYINITGGKGVSDALEEMLSADDVNTTDSMIKKVIDMWYKNNLLSYSSYLEDTVFCNDRSIRSLGSWNPNGGRMNFFLEFKEYNVTSDLSCSNETDRFSVSNSKAQLTYPVGLATSPEINLLGNKSLRASGEYYWLASPYSFYQGYTAYGRYVYTTGYSTNGTVYSTYGVRPSVSLTPGTEYSSGDGSMANPYVVKMNE